MFSQTARLSPQPAHIEMKNAPPFRKENKENKKKKKKGQQDKNNKTNKQRNNSNNKKIIYYPWHQNL